MNNKPRNILTLLLMKENNDTNLLNNNTKQEYIICSAIHYNDGKQYTHQPKNITSGLVVCGRRHHNCITTISQLAGENYNKSLVARDAQGFLTNTDRFVSRKEAYEIAYKAKQIIHQLHSNNPEENILISEDLYSEDIY